MKGRDETRKEQCKRYLLKVLAAVLHDQKAPPLPEGLDLEMLYELAEFHGVESMAFYGVKEQIAQESPIFKKWEKRDLRNLLLAVSQEAALKEVISRLTKAGIKVIPMKGSAVPKLYGQIHFRYMGDLDLLIENDKSNEARQVMDEAGYETEEFGEQYHDTYLFPPYLCVELHKSMLPDGNPYGKYFEEVWNRARPDEEIPGCFRMAWEDFYLFHLVHFKKHYRHSGSGIRAILDTYQLQKQYGCWMDRDRLNRLTEELGLKDFCHYMEFLSIQWFGTKKEKEEASGQNLTGMEEKILGSGLYGARFIEASSEYWAMVESGKAFPGIRYFFGRLFPGKERMALDYHILSRFPQLLPFCWVHRWAAAVFYKRKLLYQELRLLSGKGSRKPEA